ncbi:MAG: 3-methyl-2-oxobutanoate dehydrogenase subunit beta [bacterium]
MTSIKQLPYEEYFFAGNGSCPGCGLTIGLRNVLKALGKNVYMVVPASCSSVVQSPFPNSSAGVPLLNTPFAASAAVSSGMTRALKLMNKDAVVMAWAGDGGTFDIGLAALSGAAERNEDILYICYDNEAYMNTGGHRSGATPLAAFTGTTPTGKRENKKNVPFIMAHHGIPYVATGSIAFITDLYDKILKAKDIKGFRYIQFYSPCTPGWLLPTEKSVESAKLAVQTGIYPLFEIENGVFRVSPPSKAYLKKEKRKPLEEYFRLQGRFKNITAEQIKVIEEWIDEFSEKLAELDGKKII